MHYMQGWKNKMWHHIVKSNDKLYHNGAEVKEIKIEGFIVNVIVDDKNTIWLKIKEK